MVTYMNCENSKFNNIPINGFFHGAKLPFWNSKLVPIKVTYMCFAMLL